MKAISISKNKFLIASFKKIGKKILNKKNARILLLDLFARDIAARVRQFYVIKKKLESSIHQIKYGVELKEEEINEFENEEIKAAFALPSLQKNKYERTSINAVPRPAI